MIEGSTPTSIRDTMRPVDYVRPEKIEYMIKKAGVDWRNQTSFEWAIDEKPEACEIYLPKTYHSFSRRAGSTVTLYHITPNHGPPLDNEFVKEVEQSMGVELLQMPIDKLGELYAIGGHGDPVMVVWRAVRFGWSGL